MKPKYKQLHLKNIVQHIYVDMQEHKFIIAEILKQILWSNTFLHPIKL